MKKKILALVVVIITISTVSLVATADDSCQHKYVYSSIESGIVYYSCTKCNNITTKRITDVKDMWDNNLLNTYDDNSYMDLVPDGFINAKDFAKIRNEYSKYKRTPDLDIGGGF